MSYLDHMLDRLKASTNSTNEERSETPLERKPEDLIYIAEDHMLNQMDKLFDYYGYYEYMCNHSKNFFTRPSNSQYLTELFLEIQNYLTFQSENNPDADYSTKIISFLKRFLKAINSNFEHIEDTSLLTPDLIKVFEESDKAKVDEFFKNYKLSMDKSFNTAFKGFSLEDLENWVPADARNILTHINNASFDLYKIVTNTKETFM